MNKHAERRGPRRRCSSDVYQMIAWSAATRWHLVKQLHRRRTPRSTTSFGSFRSNMLSLVRPRRRDGPLPRRAARARRRRQHRSSTSVGLPAATGDLIEEEVKPWTYMKFPFITSPRSGARLVPGRAAGARAELRLHPHARWPSTERQRVRRLRHGGAPVHATLAYHWARMIEMLHAAEVHQGTARTTTTSSADELMASGERAGARRRRDRGAARHADPPLPGGRRRPGDDVPT
ncbi:MAG: hypothetical protein MZW92_16180 [Comamonadaceae bacterium]|nr:hypothetical protein [Comamonadaceae bacterium]